jgi:hypothetical protein
MGMVPHTLDHRDIYKMTTDLCEWCRAMHLLRNDTGAPTRNRYCAHLLALDPRLFQISTEKIEVPPRPTQQRGIFLL